MTDTLSTLRTKLSNFGVGGIVVADNEPDWVRASDFQKILDRSYDLVGIRYFDSARGYELSEEEIGKWMKRRSAQESSTQLLEQIAIGTKFSLKSFESGGDVTAYVSGQLDISLRNLGLGSVDLYWLHAPSPKASMEAVLRALDHEVRTGRVKHYGLSNVSVAEVEEALALCQTHGLEKPTAIQNEYNLVVRKSAEPMLQLCEKENLLFFAFSPLAAGLLAGRYPSVDVFPEGTRWKGWKDSRPLPDYWTLETFENLKTLRALSIEKDVSTAGLALAGCTADPRVSVVILGPKTAEQLKPAEEAQSLVISRTDLHRLQDIF